MTRHTQTNRWQRWRMRNSLGGVLVLGMAVALGQALGQETTPPGFQAYRLTHADASKVASQVKDVATGADAHVEILLDRPLNRVLVKGSPEAHRVAKELIAALDQPPVPAPAAQGEEPAILKGYRVAADRLEAAAQKLQRKYPPGGAVRIVPDPRTQQLLILASPTVHQEIARELEPPNHAPAPAEPGPQPILAPAAAPAGGAAALTGQAYRFQHVSWREMEDRLRQTWSERLSETLQRNGELAVFRLSTSGGAAAEIAIDRRNETAWVNGPAHLTAAALQVLRALDEPAANAQTQTQLVSVRNAKPEAMRRAAELLQAASQAAQRRGEAIAPLPSQRGQSRWAGDLLTMIFQQGGQEGQPPANQPVPPNVQAPGFQPQPPGAPLPAQPQQPPGAEGQIGPAVPGAEGQTAGGFIGPVQIEFVEGFDAMIIRGHPQDVERVKQIIQEILAQARETAPAIEVYYLRYVNSEALTTLVNTVYTASLAARQGTVSITALVQPNAVLLVGRPDNVASVVEFIKKLDLPLGPDSEFEVFMLKHAAALDVQTVLRNFYNEGQALPSGAGQVAGAAGAGAQLRPGLGTRPRVVADYRSNALIVFAAPRDLEEIRRLIARLDVAKIDSSNEIRVFRLKNSLAEQLAPVLQEAITGQQAGQQVVQQQVPGQQGQIGQIRSRMLYLVTIDQAGDKLIDSGVLTDVKVVADVRANTLIITAPAQSMDLIAALVRELDDLPAAEAQVKVFTIINGDAQALSTMLTTLFGQQQAQQAGQLALQTAAGAGESSLVPLRFAVDPRTNSIIATGSAGDLNVVEAVLLRLDEGDIQQRRTNVFRLRYAFATNVATAISNLLTQEQTILTQTQGVLSTFEAVQRQVVVVPETVTNSLIVSATSAYYDEVVRIVQDLDRRPPMVVIQVLIAEVTLNNTDEFGAEFGLQDSLLFSRSGLTSGNLVPGYNFNNQPLGNAGDAQSLATREQLAGQALTSFSLGRTGAPGYGGLVLSASNESISILLRALQADGRARILSRPQVMTLDNLPAFIQRGSQVPYTGQTTVGQGGATQVSTQFANVGLLLGVTPRVTPDGLIVMEVDAENSSVADFIPVGNGGLAPQIDLSLAQTTVSARSGQTVILGGIIATSKIFNSRRIPYLSDIPIMGQLFRFDSQSEIRRELMIILTPFIVNSDYELERIKQVEFARMNWCLADVIAVHGDIGGYAGSVLSDSGVIYPDENPTAVEALPVPGGQFAPPSVIDGSLPAPGVYGPGMSAPAARPGVGPRGALPPGAGPAPSPPPSDLPLTPPAPMGGRAAPPGAPSESHRRMDNAYLPPPGYPVAPVGYQAQPGYPPMR